MKLGLSPCTQIKGDITIKAPLVDWSDEVCEEFIKRYDIPLSRAYTEYGMKRTGCFLCPFDREIEERMEILKRFEPSKYKASLFFMKDVYIAQGVKLPFNKEYTAEYDEAWKDYELMRLEMLKIWRPQCQLAKRFERGMSKGGQK